MQPTISKQTIASAAAFALLFGSTASLAAAAPGRVIAPLGHMLRVQTDGSNASQRLFVSDGSSVEVYAINNNQPGSPIATIHSNEAEGLAFSNGRLYVARASYSDVAVYDASSLKAIGVLRDPGQRPYSVAVSHEGAVYVGNQTSVKGGPGSVSVYRHGGQSPSEILTCATFNQVMGVAVNTHGDVFVNQNKVSGGSGEVDEFRGGSHKCQQLNVSVYSAGGAVIDPSTQDLLVADEGYRAVYTMAPPYQGVSNKMYLPRCTGEDIANLVIDPASGLLYTSDPNNGGDAITYPGGTLMATYHMSSAIGVAISK